MSENLIEYINTHHYNFIKCGNSLIYKGFKFTISVNNKVLIEYIPIVIIDICTEKSIYANVTNDFLCQFDEFNYDFIKTINYLKAKFRVKRYNNNIILNLLPIYKIIFKYNNIILPKFKYIINNKYNKNTYGFFTNYQD